MAQAAEWTYRSLTMLLCVLRMLLTTIIMGHRVRLNENEARLVGNRSQPFDKGNAVLSGWHDVRAHSGRATVGPPNGGYDHDSKELLGEW